MKLTQPLFILLLLCCLINKCIAQDQPFKIDSLVTINLAEGIDLSHKYSNRHQTKKESFLNSMTLIISLGKGV